MTTEKRLAQIKRSCERIRNGQTPELPLDRCADYAAWMKRYHKAPDGILDPVIDEITACFEVWKFYG